MLLFIKQCPPKFGWDNWYELTKGGAKAFSGIVIFPILSSEIPLDFY